MPLHNFTVDGTNPDWLAAIQQSCLMTALALDSPDQVNAVLAACGGGKLLQFYYNSSEITPNRIIVQQDNRVYVHCYGIQMNSTGALIGAGWLLGQAVYFEKVNRVANYFWANYTKPAVEAAIAGIPNLQLYFVGYSFGGMVCSIAACEYAKTLGVNNVHLMTFGAPKTFIDFSVGNAFTLPVDFVMFQNEHDPVPFLPVDEMSLLIVVASKFKVGKRSVNWQHIKGIWQLQISGGQQMFPVAYWNTDYGSGNDIFDYTPHYMPAYVTNTLAAAIGHNKLFPTDALYPLAQSLAASDPGPISIGNVTTGNFTTPNDLNLAFWGSVAAGPVTADNINQVQSFYGTIVNYNR